MDKRMKMKLLDYTLLCLLAGATTPLATAAAKLDGGAPAGSTEPDRKSTRLNSSH